MLTYLTICFATASVYYYFVTVSYEVIFLTSALPCPNFSLCYRTLKMDHTFWKQNARNLKPCRNCILWLFYALQNSLHANDPVNLFSALRFFSDYASRAFSSYSYLILTLVWVPFQGFCFVCDETLSSFYF